MSIKKQSGISTNTLKDVTRKDKNVLLVFPKRKILLSTEDYLSGYFYPGKEFSDDEILVLKKKSGLRKAESYLHSLLRNRRYTIKEVKDKLKKNAIVVVVIIVAIAVLIALLDIAFSTGIIELGKAVKNIGK